MTFAMQNNPHRIRFDGLRGFVGVAINLVFNVRRLAST